MFNMIKMDVYRMFKMKSLYVIWVIMTLMLVMTTWLTRTEYDDAENQTEEYQQQMEEASSEDNIMIGMQVIVPTEVGKNITVFDMMFANIQAKLIALFIVIFVVLYSTADIGSGYIKNFGGQVKHREGLVISKGFSVFIYIVITMLLLILVQAVSNIIFLGYLKWGALDKLIPYLGIQTILHLALAMIVMAIAIATRNNVFSMMFAVCMCMNVMALLYYGIEIIIKKIGLGTVHVIKYTISRNITTVSANLTRNDGIQAIVLSVVYIGIAAMVSIILYRKRDIC